MPAADPDAARADALARMTRLARLLDSSIALPGGYRIGLDGLLGLIPGIGDFIGLLASGYIVMLAARCGVPRSVLVLMTYNILIEVAIGSVPLLGDVFDFVWKANERNVELYRKLIADPGRDRQRRRIKVAAPIVVFVALITAGAALIITLLRLLLRAAGLA